MKVLKKDLEMMRGDTFKIRIKIEKADPDSITELILSVKKSNADAAYAVQEKLSNGGAALQDDGSFVVRIAPEDTEDLEPGDYVYDLESHIDDIDVYTLMHGKLTIQEDVTR